MSSPPPSTELKLIAFDAEDLAVISAHVQDAVLRVGDMAYLPRERRFAAVVNRFDWIGATASSIDSTRSDESGQGAFARRRTALRFERVTDAKVSGFDLKAKRRALSLLALQFEPTSPPGGRVNLVFSGGAAIRLDVECLEAELRDLGAAWAAKRQPRHPDPGNRSG